MKINELIKRTDINQIVKLNNLYTQFETLLEELRKRELSDETVISFNKDIEEINSMPNSGNELRKQIKKIQTRIVKTVEKEHKLVPKNYYRGTWMAMGMMVFGMPIGVAIGIGLGNLAFLGIGLPLGLSIGLALGAGMDKKAFEEGRQLDLEIKY